MIGKYFIVSIKKSIADIQEFEKRMEAVKKMNEVIEHARKYELLISEMCLICVDKEAKIRKLVNKALRKSSMTLATISKSVQYFSKGKMIKLAEILPKLIIMHDSGVEASRCGWLLAKSYRTLARMEEIKSAAIELGKHNYKGTKEEAERVKNIMKKQKAMKQTSNGGLELIDIPKFQKEFSKLGFDPREFNKKTKTMKQTIYFKEDTQELIPIPIEESNCYYVGELKPKVIKRIERLLKDKILSYAELMILLEHNKKFRYSYHEDYIAVSLCEYTKIKKENLRIHARIRDINDLKKQ